MQIPLDYYRILGVPVQAQSDLIEATYQDRLQQLPRREYSDLAIASRQNLLTKAYQFLKSPSLRQEYDAQFVEPNLQEKEIEEEEEITSLPVKIPLISLEESLFIGALMILHELGEYEIILNLAQPYLEGKEKLVNLSENTEDLNLVWQDLILSITQAYMELAKEQWLQKQYELAAVSLTRAYSLLQQEELFSTLRKEIDKDLQRLRPYQIWELLTKKNNEFKDRRNAVNLLRQMLDLRGGIEGTKSEGSGLNLDDFLKFIQQTRVYLTCAEQQELFEQEARRPSPAASYLAVYALIARGFNETKPQLIVRAKNILISLTVHQDVYLEQSICALLLGQTTEAEFCLSQSREKETLEYIQEMSQDSPDLLPGLCSYTEKWLQTEVYSQFRDLTRQPVSLKEYFDNPRVQNYLEKLSVLDQETSELQDSSPSISSLSNDSQAQQISSTSAQFNALKQKTQNQENLFNEPDLTVDYPETQPQVEPSVSDDDNRALNLLTAKSSNSPQLKEELANRGNFRPSDLDSNLTSSPSVNSTPVSVTTIAERQGDSTSNGIKQKFSFTNFLANKQKLMGVSLVFFLFLGLIFFAYKLLTRPPMSSLQISLTEPLLELPPDNGGLVEPSLAENSLDQQIAMDVIRKWLSAKVLATGPEYNLAPLDEILTEPLLSRWRATSNSLRNKNAYHRYEHSIAIESVESNPSNPNTGTAIARVKEKSQYYRNGALNQSISYQEELLVKYSLIRKGNNWLIQEIKVIN